MPYYCTGSVGEGVLLLAFMTRMHHHDLYYVPVVSCSYLVRLVLSLFAHTVIARSACLSIVRPCRRYQHRFIPWECRAWGVAAELELGFAAGSKKDVCRTHDFLP